MKSLFSWSNSSREARDLFTYEEGPLFLVPKLLLRADGFDCPFVDMPFTRGSAQLMIEAIAGIQAHMTAKLSSEVLQ